MLKLWEPIFFNQFVLCTREITTNSDKFGNTLFRILCNPKKIAYYLFIEMFSDYPEKKEVMLSQGSKFKVLTFMIFTMRQNRTTTYAEKYTLDM